METTFELDTANGRGTVTLSGRLDVLGTYALRERIESMLAAGCRDLVVDLTDLTFIDSAGLAVLVRARRDAQAASGDCVLVRPRSQDAMRIFHLTHFDQVFTMTSRSPHA